MSFNYPQFFSVWHTSDKKYGISQQTDAEIKAMARQHARQCIENEPERYVPVIPVDFILHDEGHPFCDDMECPCHRNTQAKARHVFRPAMDGLLTQAEALRILHGMQL